MAAFSAMLVVVFSYIGRRAKRRVGEAA
jgi:hypothetical protein